MVSGPAGKSGQRKCRVQGTSVCSFFRFTGLRGPKIVILRDRIGNSGEENN